MLEIVRMLTLAVVLMPGVGQETTRDSVDLRTPCGDPMMVSDGYFQVEARVLGVVDGQTLEVEREGTVRHVRLSGVHAPVGDAAADEAKRVLGEAVQGKEITILVHSLPKAQEPEFSGRVWARGPVQAEVNQELLRMGVASYEDTDDLDWWTECEYKRSEASAQEARRGIWGSVRR